ncbi:MAG: helix-turn-helix transcriptional regulator [Zoogloeaceae bacterium]|jgi:putative transcriptional regulator|nr:helix-turn-helix transcriptional regulator [Zoogloeaceae bacterium]
MDKAIRSERLRRNWTQEDVARLVGLSRVAINDIEHGKQLPSYKVLVQLEKVFGMSHTELLANIEDDEEARAG